MHTVYRVVGDKIISWTPDKLTKQHAIKISGLAGDKMAIDKYNTISKSPIEAVERELLQIDRQILNLEVDRSELNNLWVKLTLSKEKVE